MTTHPMHDFRSSAEDTLSRYGLIYKLLAITSTDRIAVEMGSIAEFIREVYGKKGGLDLFGYIYTRINDHGGETVDLMDEFEKALCDNMIATMEFFCKCAEISDKPKYIQILLSDPIWGNIRIAPADFALYLKQIVGQSLEYYNGNFYYGTKTVWVLADDTLLKQFISLLFVCLTKMITDIHAHHESQSDRANSTQWSNLLMQVNSLKNDAPFSESVYNYATRQFVTHNFRLDDDISIIPFRSCVYDIGQQFVRPYTEDDRVSLICGDVFIKSESKIELHRREQLEEVFTAIQPQVAQKLRLLQTCAAIIKGLHIRIRKLFFSFINLDL